MFIRVWSPGLWISDLLDIRNLHKRFFLQLPAIIKPVLQDNIKMDLKERACEHRAGIYVALDGLIW